MSLHIFHEVNAQFSWFVLYGKPIYTCTCIQFRVSSLLQEVNNEDDNIVRHQD